MNNSQHNRIFGRALTALFITCAFIVSIARADEPEPVAIVVHPSTQIDNVSMTQLRKIFLADQQYWPDNSRIILLVHAPDAYEREFVLKSIYRMSEDQFRRYWIAKMFRAEVSSGPKVVFSSNMARELVSAIPGSITFMQASEVGDDSKVIRVDGKLPSDLDYPLK